MSSKILQKTEHKTSLSNITIGSFLFQCAQKYGERICQVDADADKSESYSSVCKRSTRLAIQLDKRGIKSDDIIACCSYNSMDNVIPIIAAMFLGTKTANLDPTLSLRHTQHLLNLTTPKIIFVDYSSLNLIENSLQGTKSGIEIIVFGQSLQYAQFSDLIIPDPLEEKFQPVQVDVNEIAILFYSSGTTGLPKAICHSHFSMLEIIKNLAQSDFDPSAVLHFTTFYWISALMLTLIAFKKGGRRVFLSNSHVENIFRTIEKYQLSLIFMAPALSPIITNYKGYERYNVSSLRYILLGGSPLSEQQFTKLSKIFNNGRIIFCYGLTEIGFATYFKNIDYNNMLIKKKFGSCGKIAGNCRFKIVDQDTGKVLGANQIGEILIKSTSSMVGYYKMDSSDCFDADGYLKSGDLGYFDDEECIYIVGRLKEMFKYKSWHIVPSLIEAVLLEHPDVVDCAVVGVPVGEDGEVPAACLVVKPNSRVAEEDIELFVNDKVSDREKLRGVIIVDHLPKTPTGKLLRKDIKDLTIKSVSLKM